MDRSYESYQRFGSETSTALARLINYMFYDNKVTLNLVLSRKQKIPDSNSKTGRFQGEIWNISLKELEIKRAMKRGVYQISGCNCDFIVISRTDKM